MTKKKDVKKKKIDIKEVKSPSEINRKKRDYKTWYYIAGLFFICVVFFHRVISGSWDFWEDLIYQEFPNRIFARDSLLHFQFPHWNPYTFGGMPFFAGLQAGVLYPFNLLISLFSVNNGTFWYLLQIMIISHFFFAGISMFIYTSNKKLSKPACFFASIGYMFCGFFVTHVVHSMMLNILVWLPLVVMFLEKGLKERKMEYSIISGIILGLSTLAGHPQITFYEFIFLGSYSLYLLITLPSKKTFSLILIIITFGVTLGIALILFLPAIELSNHSARVSWTFDQASEGSMSYTQILTFLMPKVFGAWTGPGSQAPQYWLPGLLNGYYTYWDTCFYAGISIFILAVVQFKNLRKIHFVRFALIWAIISLSIALGRHFFVYKLLYDYIPGFGRFRSPSRILFTWNFLLPLLAASSFDQFNRENLEKFKKPLLICFAICAVFGIAVISGFFNNVWPLYMENKKNADFAALQGGILLLNTLIVSLPLIFALINKLSLEKAKILIICGLILDMFIFGINHHIVKNSGAARFFNQNRSYALAIRKESENEIFRVNVRQFLLEEDAQIIRKTNLKVLKRNQGMIDKIQLLEGYNPLNLHRRLPPAHGRQQFDMLLDLLNVKYYINPDYQNQSQKLFLLNRDRLPRAKMYYSAEVVENDSIVKYNMINNNFDYINKLILTDQPELKLPENHRNIDNKIDITKYSANKIELHVSTQKNGLLWMSEIWYPAWKAYVDGKQTKLFCADYSFRAIEIPEGNHSIQFIYRSSYFNIGLFITIITLISATGYLLFSLLKKSRNY